MSGEDFGQIWERVMEQHRRAQVIVDAQPEETWANYEEVLRVAMERGLETLEKEAGVPTPNQLSGGD